MEFGQHVFGLEGDVELAAMFTCITKVQVTHAYRSARS
jgi:hypothetical protein